MAPERGSVAFKTNLSSTLPYQFSVYNLFAMKEFSEQRTTKENSPTEAKTLLPGHESIAVKQRMRYLTTFFGFGNCN